MCGPWFAAHNAGISWGMNAFATIFGALVALIVPLRWTGRLYLVQQLQENGIDTARLPKACLQELADDVIVRAREDARIWHANVRAQVVQFTEGWAILIAQVLKGTASGGDTNDRIRFILGKHGVLPSKDDEMEKRAAKLGLLLHMVAEKLRDGTSEQFIAHFRETAKVVASDDGREASFGVNFSPARWYDIHVEFTGPNGSVIGMLGGGEDYGVFILSSADEKAWVQLKVQPGHKPGQCADAMVRALLAEPKFKSMVRPSA
jgi:hypothetical protein